MNWLRLISRYSVFRFGHGQNREALYQDKTAYGYPEAEEPRTTNRVGSFLGS